ncbi:helix-hairpin-helix domain-containing protein [Microbacterium sp. RD1]|uniref:ComEA family DNA-binding protein n=1 Tax=Microbacterium sp. RD1 TaxID=3457313 RepID=UPI003FA60673
MTEASGKRGARRWGAGAVVVLVLAVFAVTVAVGLFRGSAGSAELVPVTASPAASGQPASPETEVAYVHVAGAVAAPGLYPLMPGARVADAVAMAGGFAPDADRAAVNLARAVQDGEQILVPVVGAAPAPPVSADAGGEGAPLDLNTADAAALDTLPGIGPALSGRILAWREENGPFASVDDLLAVPGIGEKLVAGLRDLVRV